MKNVILSPYGAPAMYKQKDLSVTKGSSVCSLCRADRSNSKACQTLNNNPLRIRLLNWWFTCLHHQWCVLGRRSMLLFMLQLHWLWLPCLTCTSLLMPMGLTKWQCKPLVIYLILRESPALTWHQGTCITYVKYCIISFPSGVHPGAPPAYIHLSSVMKNSEGYK